MRPATKLAQTAGEDLGATVVAIAIVTFLVSYVVPQVATVFAGSKQALPFLTVAMMAISGFVRQWGLLVAALAQSLRREEQELLAAAQDSAGVDVQDPQVSC